MMFKIVVFPGQGSQRKNMALDFVSSSEEARLTFQEASDAIELDLVKLIESDDEDRLNLTENAQPSILTAEIAMYRALYKMYDFEPEVFGGHSLGEYTALVVAGVIPFVEAVKLVRIRGQLMQAACPVGVGGMAAVIGDGLPLAQIEEVCASNNIDIANDNSPDQVVLSGEKPALEKVLAQLTEILNRENMRLVPLEVSAPFHSRHMAAIESQFKEFLTASSHTYDLTNIHKVTSNVTGTFHKAELPALLDTLTRQISKRVRWRDNMATLVQRSTGVVEIGPGRPLGGFFKALGVPVSSIVDKRSATRAFEPKPSV